MAGEPTPLGLRRYNLRDAGLCAGGAQTRRSCARLDGLGGTDGWAHS